MKVLIVKTSSLGDVIHALPALTDAKQALPDLEIDWLVEKNFSEILSWHQGVDRIIEIEFRRWRKNPWQAFKAGYWQKLYRQLREREYDLIIDAQGLLKSALMAFCAKGPRHGLARGSSRDPFSAIFYQHHHTIDWQSHAIERLRDLFAKALNYSRPSTPIDYGLAAHFNSQQQNEKSILFLHGTTWNTKLWPLAYWQELGRRLMQEGYSIFLPWGNEVEKNRAESIAAACQGQVLPRLNLSQMALELLKVKAVIAVDTGLGHLAAALSVPTLSLYAASNALKTGTRGRQQTHLSVDYACAPCFRQECRWVKDEQMPPCYTSLTPSRVLELLNVLWGDSKS